MTANLYPLAFKPGVQRDGTSFQPDYCTDGQWIRFQRGIVKKIGGMKSLNAGHNKPFVTDILLVPYKHLIYLYLSCADQNAAISSYILTQDFQLSEDRGIISPPPPPPSPIDPTLMWQSEVVINNNNKFVAFLGTRNKAGIAQDAASVLFAGTLFSQDRLINIDIDPRISGGMCYSAPYLFLYGSDGLVQYSKNNNPFDFTISNDPASGGALTISNDKVIWGKPIRGGANSPSVLFWTLSSVVRITNVGDQEVQFRADVISRSSSILSMKCVVEYDGLFFWPGTDRFFVYNGIVTEVPNTINLNYFFNNIDMNRRQDVFGVKNTKYGEIWWFYPVKGVEGNSRVVIYNKRENCWYDTALSRECGTFSDSLGIMATYGKSITNPNFEPQLYFHEYGVGEFIEGVNYPIPSSFSTAVFSLAAFNPIKQGPGLDRFINLKRIEPDFLMDRADNEMQVIVNTRKYAQSPVISQDPITFTAATEKIDIRAQGRHITLTFNSSNNFELGRTMLLFGIGDGQ
jgi:hypothetical protein